MAGRQMDGTVRHHARGQDVSTMVCLGTFAPYTVVNQASCVKILDDIPLDKACLVGLRRHHRLGLGRLRGGRAAR